MNWWVLRRKIHISWLVALGSLGFFVGVVFAKYLYFPQGLAMVGLVVSCLVIAVVCSRRYLYLLPFVIVSTIILGLIRGGVIQSGLQGFKPYYGYKVQIVGQVNDDIDTGQLSQIVIRLGGLNIEKKKLPGLLWVTTKPANVKRGDYVVLSGVINKGFGTFSGTVYNADIEKIIHPKPGDIARVMRDRFSEAIRLAVPDPEASLGIGYLVGQRRALPADLILALQFAGLTHVVVASGYNLTILVRFTRRIFARISKYLAALAAGLTIVCFIAITGASPSMTRAGIVTGLGLIAWYYGRKFHPLVLLALAMGITVLINPSYAWGDLGWQLSFTAFAGVMILAPLAQRYFFGNKKPGTIAQIFGETISAQIVTAPILIMAFGQLSNVSLMANIMVLPLVPLAMLLTFIAGLIGFLLPGLASIAGLPAYWLLHYMVKVTEFFADLPWAMSEISISWLVALVLYVLIIAVCIYMWRVTKYNLRDSNLVE